MTKYPLDAPDDLWERFKSTVSHSETLNQRLLNLIRAAIEADRRLHMSVGEVVENYAEVQNAERYERKADGRGRVSLPGEYANGDLIVHVRHAPQEADDE